MVTCSEWRTLYRCLLRAAPRVVSGSNKQARAVADIIRHGFDQNMNTKHPDHELAALYKRGYNTLGFLKLARELGSVERRIVTSILQVQAERRLAEAKTPTSRRKLQPLQHKAYAESYEKFDAALANMARDLDIIMPQYQSKRSLEWIPRLNRLYKNDANKTP
ncbi:hypothetical protein IWW50_001303 [Coemansia erecta]|nr:hypothetical protein IWW50_001303 [Coemansia erecta]